MDEAMIHTISSDELGGGVDYLPWSCSRLKVASTCLQKFKRIYIDGVKEQSPSLTLGGLSHEIIAKLLQEKDPDMKLADKILTEAYSFYRDLDTTGEAFKEVRSFFPYMLEFVNKWNNLLKSNQIKSSHIEQAYGITRELTRSPKNDGYNNAYIRGIIDLWAYDKASGTLYVVDHKTSKSIKSANKVREDMQLLLYVAMLSVTYRMPWKRAWIGLNFIRKKKIVWVMVTPSNVNYFINIFLNTLDYLEHQIIEADNSLVWPETRSFNCKMCSFRSTCQTYNYLV